MKLRAYTGVLSWCCYLVLNLYDTMACYRKAAKHHEFGISAAAVARTERLFANYMIAKALDLLVNLGVRSRMVRL